MGAKSSASDAGGSDAGGSDAGGSGLARAPLVDTCTPNDSDPSVKVSTTPWAIPHIGVEVTSDICLADVALYTGPV